MTDNDDLNERVANVEPPDPYKQFKRKPSPNPKGLLDYTYQMNPWDKEKIRDFLAAVVCPLPCVGYVNETGWHNLCIQRATRAMVVLGLEAPVVGE